MFAHRAHGLTVLSEFELPALPEWTNWSPEAGLQPDVTVVRGRPVGAPRGPAGVLAFDATAGRRLRVSALASGGLHTEAKGIEMWLDPSFSSMHVDIVDSDEARAACPWLVGGLGLAVVMMARGALVMHASTVELDGHGHLLMAPAGHGKSLTAAAACAAGATLVAEDTTCVRQVADGGRRTPPGSHVIRTRRTRDELLGWFPEHQLGESSDGRALVTLDPVRSDVMIDRMHLIVLDSSVDAATVVGLDDSLAVMQCLSHLRVPGLLAGPELDRHFDAVADLVSDAMVDVIRLPWSGEVAGLPHRLVECLRSSEK